MYRVTLGVLTSLLAAIATAYAADAPPPDPAQVRAGGILYQQYCAACHGAQGEGAPNWQEPDEQGDMPPPPHGPDGHTWKHADGMLYRLIRQGWRDPFNKTQRLTMPAFGGTLTPGDVRAVVTYLKTLWTPEQQRAQQTESAREPFPPEAR